MGMKLINFANRMTQWGRFMNRSEAAELWTIAAEDGSVEQDEFSTIDLIIYFYDLDPDAYAFLDNKLDDHPRGYIRKFKKRISVKRTAVEAGLTNWHFYYGLSTIDVDSERRLMVELQSDQSQRGRSR